MANAFLVDHVVEFSDDKQSGCHSSGSKEACLSLDQVVANCKVDISEAAVKNQHQCLTI